MSDSIDKKDILESNPQIDPKEIAEYFSIRKEIAELTGRVQQGANYTLDGLSTIKSTGQPSVFHFFQTKHS